MGSEAVLRTVPGPLLESGLNAPPLHVSVGRSLDNDVLRGFGKGEGCGVGQGATPFALPSAPGAAPESPQPAVLFSAALEVVTTGGAPSGVLLAGATEEDGAGLLRLRDGVGTTAMTFRSDALRALSLLSRAFPVASMTPGAPPEELLGLKAPVPLPAAGAIDEERAGGVTNEGRLLPVEPSLALAGHRMKSLSGVVMEPR